MILQNVVQVIHIDYDLRVFMQARYAKTSWVSLNFKKLLTATVDFGFSAI